MVARMLPGLPARAARRRAHRPLEPQGRDGDVRHRARRVCSCCCRSSTTCSGLVVLSFLIEVLTLLWGPAKDATVPNIVKDPEQLASANSLVARRRVRHVPARRGHVRGARRRRAVARRLRRARAASASTTRSRSRSGSTRCTFLVLGAADLAACACPRTNAAHASSGPTSRRRAATSSTGSSSSARTRSCAA